MKPRLKAKHSKRTTDYILSFVSLIVIGCVLTILYRTNNSVNIQEFIKSAGLWGPIIYMIAHALVIIISPTGGGSLLIVSSGALFGFIPGIIYSFISGVVGASINYFLAGVFGQKIIAKLVETKTDSWFYNVGSTLKNLSIWLLIPVFSSAAFNVLCYVAGLTNMRYQKFLSIVVISSIANVPVYVAIGSSLINPSGIVARLALPVLIILAIIIFLIEELVRRKSDTLKSLKSTFK